MCRHDPGRPGQVMFDPERLRNWKVADTEQHLTCRDTAFYALSTGFGADPLDRRILPFVDPAHPKMRASPSMALVLAYPGFWIADPALGVDTARVLHVDQAIEIMRPLPVEGRITGRTTITDVIDRGEGRGALVVSDRVLAQEGVPFARLTQTLLLRSEGGFAGAPGSLPARGRVPDTVPDHCIHFALPEDAALFYRLNGDFNPLHSDPDVSARGGFARPIMHGMGTFGFVTRHLIAAMCDSDPGRLASIAMRFSAPGFPGDRFALHIWTQGAFALIAEDGRRVIDDGHFVLR
jgi:acyl dehydratase